jgi:cysteine synthase
VGVDSAVSPAAPGLVVATGSTGCVVGGPVAKTRMSGSGKSTATAMTGPSRFRFVGEGLHPSGNLYLSLDRMNTMTTGSSFHACRNAERSRRVGGSTSAATVVAGATG